MLHIAACRQASFWRQLSPSSHSPPPPPRRCTRCSTSAARSPRSPGLPLCLTLPFLGALLYYLFGINRVQTRARKLLTRYPEPDCPTEYVGTPPPELLAAGSTWLRRQRLAVDGGQPHRAAARRSSDFRRNAGRDSNAAHVRLLQHLHFRRRTTRPAFRRRALRSRLHAAWTCVCSSTASGEWYSWHGVAALLRGTRVRCRALPAAATVAARFISVNLRNHRKILAVDGRMAFTGGMNMREHYLVGDGATSASSICTFVCAAPCVAQIEPSSCATGNSSRARPAGPARVAGALGDALCRAVADGPEEDSTGLTELLIGAIGRRASGSPS